MMLAIPFQGLIAPKRVGGIYGPLPSFGLDMPHKFLDTSRLADFGAYAGSPVWESKDNIFSGDRSAWLPPLSPAEGGLVQFNLAVQFSTFQLNPMEQSVPYSVKDVSDSFETDTQVPSQPISGLKLKESLKNGPLSAQPTQTFSLSAEQTFKMSLAGVKILKGATKHRIAALPKVDPTTINPTSSSPPAPVVADTGYD